MKKTGFGIQDSGEELREFSPSMLQVVLVLQKGNTNRMVKKIPAVSVSPTSSRKTARRNLLAGRPNCSRNQTQEQRSKT